MKQTIDKLPIEVLKRCVENQTFDLWSYDSKTEQQEESRCFWLHSNIKKILTMAKIFRKPEHDLM